MALDYATYVAQISNLMVDQSTGTEFQTFLPGMIDYAEQRIYRELDLLASHTSDSTASLTSGGRVLFLPSSGGVFNIVEQINVYYPAGSTQWTGVKVPLNPATREFIDFMFPDPNSMGTPSYFAPLDNASYYVGPVPDGAYLVQVVGTIRPTPLSASNTTTYLTSYLPDLFIAASMVFAAGYQRDYGAGSDDPSKSTSWEGTYNTLLKSAAVEEARKKFQSEGWQSKAPSPVATPARR